MIIDLSEIEFVNDMFNTIIPSGDELILNKIDESLRIDSEGEVLTAVIKNINVEILKQDNTYVSCPCIIGISNDYLSIDTKYKEYEGESLTSDNMKYCTITVYEN